MRKYTEDLLRNYYREGYKYIFISLDDEIFVTKDILSVVTSKEVILNHKKCEEAVYLPIDELKDLLLNKVGIQDRNVAINELIEAVDWELVEVDTPVIVKRRNSYIALKRYFREFDSVNNKIAVFTRGCTSWSNDCRYPDYFDTDEVCLA